jgi:two-component SAPR family response regulator
VSLLARLAHEAGASAEVIRLGARSIALNPFDPDVHHAVLAAYRELGHDAAAAHEERVLQVLADHLGTAFRSARPITQRSPPAGDAASETHAE